MAFFDLDNLDLQNLTAAEEAALNQQLAFFCGWKKIPGCRETGGIITYEAPDGGRCEFGAAYHPAYTGPVDAMLELWQALHEAGWAVTAKNISGEELMYHVTIVRQREPEGAPIYCAEEKHLPRAVAFAAIQAITYGEVGKQTCSG